LVDASGNEQWRISLASPVAELHDSGDAMVVLCEDSSVLKFAADGDLLWQDQTLPAISQAQLNVSQSGNVQVIGITSGDTVQALVLDSDGAVVWQLQQPLEAGNSTASLVQAADDSWLLLMSGSYVANHLFSVSASGETSELAVIPELQAVNWATLEGDQQLVYITTYAALTAFNADGSLAWQYQPNRLGGTDLSCSSPTAAGFVCGHWPANILDSDLIKQTLVTRIAPDGNIIRSDLYKFAPLNRIESTADGRVVLQTHIWKDLTPNEAVIYQYLGGYINYSTTKVFVADSAGALSNAVVLPPTEWRLFLMVFPPHVGVGWDTTDAPWHSKIALGLTDDNTLIVSGILTQPFDTDTDLRPRNNYVAAYAVE